MKKILLPALMLALLSGCAGKAQRIGEIELLPTSSQGLIDLQHAGATGVRDLTRNEFHKYRRDRRAFDKANAALASASVNNAGNRAIREGLMGAALGFSFLGSAATGYFSSFGSEKTYPFYGEYHNDNILYSIDRTLDRQELFDLVEKMFHQLNSDFLNPELGGLTANGDVLIYLWDAPRQNQVLREDAINFSLDQRYENSRLRLSASIGCANLRYNGGCAVSFSTGIGNNTLPPIPVLQEFMRQLPDHYILYAFPVSSEKRLPLVIYGGNTEYHYLVEQDVTAK